jgi:hypothetical protein
VKFNYNDDYFPPIPVAEVTFITAAESLRAGPFMAVIDSGADGTIVPLSFLNEIRAAPTVEMVMRSPWGERRKVLLYLVDVQVGSITLPGIEVVGDDQTAEVILGRDIINGLRVLLDGPEQTANITE